MFLDSNTKPGNSIYTFTRLCIFFSSFSLILIYSLSPTVYAGDSGLFTSASYFLGSAHPPAYPLFILIGKLATFIPFGNIALKVNIVSAFFCASTVLLAYEATLYLTGNGIASLFAPLAILTSPNVILESSKAEVYMVNVFMIMLVFYLCLRALKETDFAKYIVLASFILGLGMGNHHSEGFMLFIIIYVVLARWKELPFGTVAGSIVVFVVGFSVYLFLYLRTRAGTFIDYSQVYSFADFLTVFFRIDYSGDTISALGSVQDLGASWMYSVQSLGLIISKEIHWLVLILAFIGLIGMISDKKVFVLSVLSIAVWIPLAKITTGNREPSEYLLMIIGSYFLQIISLTAVFMAVGVSKLSEKIKLRSSLVAKTFIIALFIPLTVLVAGAFQKSTLSNYFIAQHWIKDVSKVLKQKSFFLAFGDNPGFLSFYGLGVERLRDDVVCMDAASHENAFRLTLAPSEKFSVWYPTFYESRATSTKYFLPFAAEGRLYAGMIGSIPLTIRKDFDVRWYVLVSMLMTKDSRFPFDKNFERDFEKIDYLPIVLENAKDPLAVEIVNHYAVTIWQYATMIRNDTDRADYFYKLAIYMRRNSQT